MKYDLELPILPYGMTHRGGARPHRPRFPKLSMWEYGDQDLGRSLWSQQNNQEQRVPDLSTEREGRVG